MTEYDVKAVFGLKGDGVTDDSAAFTTALASIGQGKDNLYFPSGTYIIGSLVTVTRSLRFAAGATLQKTTTFSAATMLDVTVSGVVIDGLTLNGNRTNGAAGYGIRFSAGRCTLKNAYVYRNKGVGVYATGSTVFLTCQDSESSENDGGAGFGQNGDGFYADGGATIYCYGCRAIENNRWGYFLDRNAGSGCEWNQCYAEGNANGYVAWCDNGKAWNLTSVRDNSFGFVLGRDIGTYLTTGWVVDNFHCNRTGDGFTRADGTVIATDGAGTGLRVIGCTQNRFGDVVVDSPNGYGVAVVTNSQGGSTYNTFRSITVTGAVDPGIHMSGTSSYNTVGHASLKGCTQAFSLGEGTNYASNNHFGVCLVDKNSYGIIRCTDASSNNTWDQIVGVDNWNTGSSTDANALMWFSGAGTTGNVIKRFRHKTITSPAPAGTFNQVSSATGNSYTAG